jgi:peptide/nickel transport system substrate-binding protein
MVRAVMGRGRCQVWCRAAVLGLIAVLPLRASVASHAAGGDAPARGETLYTSGTSFSPPTSFNPLSPVSYTGSQGLLYEPLFLYDPLHAKFIPWLATGGTWAGPTTYRLEIRSGVNWVSSTTGSVAGTLSSADVAYSINLAVHDSADPYHADAAGVEAATATGGTVTVSFTTPVGYARWQELLWHLPVVPRAVWSALPAGARVSAANLEPVSTGPMLLEKRASGEACYRDNPHWWASAQLGLSFRFEYLCDVVSGTSGADLSALLDDRVDWSNELLRGVPDLTDGKASGYGIKTYYDSTPYMLPAGTAWLQMDAARAPMDNVNFRRAVAYALDRAAIVSGAYAGVVKVADPTGLLPELGQFIDGRLVRKHGFYHSQSLAKRYLAKSGYRGQHLILEVPEGWSDLDSAASIICQQLSRVGVHVVVRPVIASVHSADIVDGDYDMAINIAAGPSSTPWAYFDKVYQLPVGTTQGSGVNTERFSSAADWGLVQQAAATPTSDARALDGVYDRLEADFLRDLPEVPLWYSGAWFQANTTRWEGYPTSTDPKDQFTPVMWAGWLGSTTTVYALAALRPHH